MGVKIGPKSGMIRTDVELKESTKLKVSNTDFLDLLKRIPVKIPSKNWKNCCRRSMPWCGSCRRLIAEDPEKVQGSHQAVHLLCHQGSIEVLDQSGIDIYGSPRSYKIIRKVDDSFRTACTSHFEKARSSN